MNAVHGRVTTPEIDDLKKALKLCAVEEPQEKYPCEGCYLYPLSKDGRMSTGRTCFEHLVLDVVDALTRLDDFTNSECARQLEKNAVLTASLAQYRKAEEDELLVRLPIKPGTPVWVLEKKLGSVWYDLVRERFVNSFGFSTDGYTNMQLMVPEGICPYPVHDVYREIDKVGKTVFLTRAEAEAALEENGGN